MSDVVPSVVRGDVTERLAVHEERLEQLRREFEASAKSQGTRIGQLEPKPIRPLAIISFSLTIAGALCAAWIYLQSELEKRASVQALEKIDLALREMVVGIKETNGAVGDLAKAQAVMGESLSSIKQRVERRK